LFVGMADNSFLPNLFKRQEKTGRREPAGSLAQTSVCAHVLID
jgi:hypothetical protein